MILNVLCFDVSNNVKILEFKSIIMFNVFVEMILLRLVCVVIKLL